MRQATNYLLFLLCCVASFVGAWLAVEHVGLETARLALRYAFGPGVALAGFAFNLLGKVPDLAEMKGLSIAVIDRLQPRLTIVQRRLWGLICAVTLASVVGWIVSSVDALYVIDHRWPFVLTVACLTTLFAATIVAVFYLPMLQMDYTAFRLRVMRDLREVEAREEAVKKLKG